MALTPTDPQHALQILAGAEGRRKGHKYELELAQSINKLSIPHKVSKVQETLFRGNVEEKIIDKALELVGWSQCDGIEAIALGALATAEEGKKWMEVNGMKVRACKSDILLNLHYQSEVRTIGISVKQCDNRTPTNAQLYFTTATAFIELLRRNKLSVSDRALNALKQFCGDSGYRPLDNESITNRKVDPRRFFWEEIDEKGKLELEKLFTDYQDDISKLLFQKAYLNDPFIPELLLHKTKKKEEGLDQEYALYTIEELITLSKKYSGFYKKSYSVRKGSYKDPEGVSHEAPRFGVIQMQRGGQKQHPTQLQFNLQAGYFYHI